MHSEIKTKLFAWSFDIWNTQSKCCKILRRGCSPPAAHSFFYAFRLSISTVLQSLPSDIVNDSFQVQRT